MRVLLWHVHGSWTTAFVQGAHEYLVPVLPERGPDGRGRARTWDWPASVREVTPDELADTEVDVVLLQRPHELTCLAPSWLRRRPGPDVPAIFLEHDTPQGDVNAMRHPAADRRDLTLVHVTWFNQLMWDAGSTPSVVIEHGVVDPGHRYLGELERGVVVVNEPLRRGRVTGTDLIASLRARLPIDVFGMGAEPLGGSALTQAQLHEAMSQRRCYLHTTRWTSLGLSLIEAMHLGMPVLALATTEAAEAVPSAAGVVSTRPDVLAEAGRRLLADPDAARAMGAAAREAALARYGLDRFLDDWDALLEQVAR